MTVPAVELEDVIHRFGDAIAADRLGFEVARGEAVALLGPNGAGKSTALEVVLGLLRPEAGAVRVLGGAAAEAVAAGRVGAMPQNGGLPRGARVGELVELARRLHRRPLGRSKALRIGDLESLARRRVEGLSGGEAQRVRLAFALAGRPELLVLDEPTAALDVAARRSFWSRTREHLDRGGALLFATHRFEEAERIADRVLVISAGRVVADGSPLQVRRIAAAGLGLVSFRADGIPLEALERLPAVEAVELARGRASLSTLDPGHTARALLEQVGEVEELEVTLPRLEDALVTLTGEAPGR